MKLNTFEEFTLEKLKEIDNCLKKIQDIETLVDEILAGDYE